MPELVECVVDGGTWIMGTLSVTKEQYLTMTPEENGTFNAVLKHDGWVYYYDGLNPEFDFTYGTEGVVINFSLSKENVFAKRPE